MLVCPVCAAYFVQGVKMSLGTLTEQFYLKDDLQFDPAQVTCQLLLVMPSMFFLTYIVHRFFVSDVPAARQRVPCYPVAVFYSAST